MKLKTLILLFSATVSGTLSASVLTDLRPCSKVGAFNFEQKTPYQALKTTVPIVGNCLVVPNKPQEKVCMQGLYQAEKDNDADYFKMSYWREGKQLVEWKSDGFLMAPAETFNVELLNVDGDSDLELVVSVMTSEGMGMGVQSSDIYVLDRKDLTISVPISAEDYGRISGFYGKSGQACRLLVSTWQSHEDDKGNGGLYAEGAWYLLKDTQWLESSAWPKMSRRYLFRFQDERSAAKTPLLWFLDKTTELE